MAGFLELHPKPPQGPWETQPPGAGAGGRPRAHAAPGAPGGGRGAGRNRGERRGRCFGPADALGAQPQEPIWIPVVTLGAVWTPQAPSGSAKPPPQNAQKGPHPPSHQVPRELKRETTVQPSPDPAAHSFPFCLVGRLNRCPERTWDRRGQFHLSPGSCAWAWMQAGKPGGAGGGVQTLGPQGATRQ